MTKPRLLTGAPLLLLAASALALAGCTTGTGTTNAGAASSHGPASTPASTATAAASQAPSSTGTYRDQIMAWGRQFAACSRAHGMPSFPDPSYPAGVGPNGPEDTTDLFPDAGFGITLFPTTDKGMLVQALDA